MQQPFDYLMQDKKNIVFVGEAGCGKSEAALNFAVQLAQEHTIPVHFFDLDQTKPLFRSRDARNALEQHDIAFYYEKHDFDAPTIVGGVAERLTNPQCHAVLDIGGGEPGARMIGRFARQLNYENTAVFYVVNPYRPWSREILAIDGTLSAILRVSHIKKVRVLINPNLGSGTTAEEFLEGCDRAKQLLGEYVQIEAACAREEIYEAVKDAVGMPVLPLRLFLQYEWTKN